jgi:hypothetical protein
VADPRGHTRGRLDTDLEPHVASSVEGGHPGILRGVRILQEVRILRGVRTAQGVRMLQGVCILRGVRIRVDTVDLEAESGVPEIHMGKQRGSLSAPV